MQQHFTITAFADEISSNLAQQIKTLKDNDIHHIELRSINGRNISEYSLIELKEVKDALQVAEIKVSSIGSPIGKINITEEFLPHLELFKHVLDIADYFSAKYIRMFSFYIPKGEDPNLYEAEVVRRWQKFIEIAQYHNITISLYFMRMRKEFMEILLKDAITL